MRPNQSMSDRTISEGNASMKISRKFFRRSSRWQRARKHTLMLPLFVTAAVAGGIMRPHSAHADTVNWLGPNGTINWDAVFQDSQGFSHTYWSNNSVPGSNSDAVNSNALAGIQLTNNYTINSLLSAGAFTINAGGLTGNQANAGSAIQVNNLFTIDGGYLSNFTVNAGTGGQGVTFSGNGNNYIQNCVFFSRLDFGTGAFAQAYNSNTINGLLNMSGGNVRLYNSAASLTVGATGSIIGYGTVNQLNGGATLTNNGLINANVNGQTLATNLSGFSSTGTLQADNGGTLALNTVGSVSGIIQALNGGIVAINSDLTSATGTTVHGDTGTVLVNGGGVSGAFSTTGTGLTFNGNGNNDIGYYTPSSTITGNVTLGSGFVNVYNANTLQTGNLSLAGGNARLYNSNASLTLGSDYTLAGYGTINQLNGGATLTNNGLINANVNGQTLTTNLSSFTSTGTLQADNSTLALNTGVNISGILQAINGGTVVVNNFLNTTTGTTIHADTGTVLIDGGGLTGTFTTTGTGLTFNGNGNNYLQDASITGSVTLGSGFVGLYNADTLHAGTLSLAGGNARLYNSNSVLTLGSDYTLAGYGTISQLNGGAVLNVNGLLNANTNGAALNVGLSSLALGSTGTLQASSGGILQINSPLTAINGTVQALNNSQVNITSSFSGSNTTVHADTGTVLIDGGGLTGTFTTTGTGLTFNGNGNNYLQDTSITGSVTLGSGFVGLYNADTLHAGTLSLAGGNARLYNSNSVLTLGSDYTVAGYGTVNQLNGGATLTNNGLINANVNGQALNVNLSSFNNAATAEATNGATLAINSSTALSGILQSVGSGSQITLTGLLTGSSGTIHADTGTVLADNLGVLGTFTTTGTGLTFSGNGNNYLQDTSITGNVTIGGGFANLYNADALHAGTLSLAGGNARLYNSNSVLTLGSDYTLAGYGTVNQLNGGANLTNNGLINANVNAQTLNVALDNITGGGTFRADNSTLAIGSNNFASTNATLQAVNNGVINLTGSLTGSNFHVNAAGGTVSLTGALTGSISSSTGAGLNFTGDGGNSLNGATVNTGGIVTLGAGSFVNVYNTDTINGTLAMNGGQARLYNSATNLLVGAGGNLSGSGLINQLNGGANVTNNGLINANQNGQTLNVSVDNVTNTGTMQATNGATLAVQPNLANSGTLRVDSGSTFNANGGITQTAGTTHTNGSLTLAQTFAVQGGTVQGTGTITGDIVNTGGTLKPGDVGPGTLTQTGSYTQSAGGVFLEQLGGTTPGASGVFSLTGNAALDGTLDVQLANGFHPVVNQSFVFLNYGQRVNTPQGVPSTFANVVSLDDGFSYTVAYDDTAHDATLTVVTASAPVPETGTMVSLGLMLGLGGWMIRRRRTAVTTDTLPQPAV